MDQKELEKRIAQAFVRVDRDKTRLERKGVDLSRLGQDGMMVAGADDELAAVIFSLRAHINERDDLLARRRTRDPELPP